MPETRIIKRYANRKLYDTEHSRYVTLDQISEMIRNGDDVKIVDNKTKEDLTTVTLAQIIFEEEKKQRSFLPLAAMRNIIQSGALLVTAGTATFTATGFDITLNNTGNDFSTVSLTGAIVVLVDADDVGLGA